MKLMTHNILACPKQKCAANNFPLRILPTELEAIEAEERPEFVTRLLARIEYRALVEAAESLAIEGLPAEIPADAAENAGFLSAVHHALFEINIKEGTLVCPNCAREFPISNSIPDMTLKEDEVK